MKVYLPVQWHTGMLMLAQHFQQQDKYYHNLLRDLFGAACPYLYGVKELKYSFSNNAVKITALHVILPNLIQLILEDSVLDDFLEIDLKNYKIASGQVYGLYLAVPEENMQNQGSYLPVAVGPVGDDFDAENKEMIVKLKPNIKLHFGEQSPIKHTSLKLFDFKMINGEFVMLNYKPAFLCWDKESVLWKRLDGLCKAVRKKIDYLEIEDKISIKNLARIKGNLVNGLIGFEEQLRLENHPYNVFKALLFLLGHVLSLTNATLPRFIYNHDDIVGSFVPCIDYALNALSSIHEKYSRVMFKFIDNMMRVPISKLEKYTENGVSYYLCSVKTSNNTEFLDDWINSCVIASDSMLDAAIANRVLGAKRTILEYVSALNTKSTHDMLFFKIEIDDHFIKDEDEFLAFYNDQSVDKTPAEIIGYASF